MPARRASRFEPCDASVAALCAAFVALAPTPSHAERIGVASAVVPQAVGERPNADPVVLRVGRDMVVNERVTTSGAGRAQLLFVDGSALMVGPNSDLVLDSYVFDADAKAGEATFSAARGVFRLVGGKLTKASPVTIRTPSATIGIRGGIALVEVGEEATSATFLFGERMTVTSGGVTKVAERPGYTIEVDGGSPTDPRPASSELLSGKLQNLEGSEAEAVPQPALADEDVAERQVAPHPGVSPLERMRPQSTAAAPAPAARRELLAELRSIVPDASPSASELEASSGCEGVCVGGLTGRAMRSAGAGLALTAGTLGGGRFRASGYELFARSSPGSFQVGGGNQPTATPFGAATGSGELVGADFILYKLAGADGTRQLVFAGLPANAVPSGGVEAFKLDEDFLRGSNLAFIDPIPYSGGSGRAFIAWDASATGAQRAFAGGAVVISGQGTAQQSGAFMLTGSVSTDAAGRPFVAGRMDGYGRFAPTGAPTVYESAVSTAEAGDGSDFLGGSGGRHFVLESARVDALDAPLGGDVSRTVGATATSFSASAVAFPAAYAPAGRSSRTLNGFMAGVERNAATGAADHVRTKAGDPTKTTIVTDASLNTVSADFMLDGDSATTALRLGFGESAPAGKSAFIDDATFVASASGFTRNGSPIDGRGGLITSAFLQADGLLPPGVQFCACDYLVWGFVGADRQRTSAGAVTERASLELASFVAGQLSDTSQLVGLPALSATYNGHIAARVANGSGASTQYYTAVGSLSLGFTFGGGSYALKSVTIQNLDGANLSGAGSAAFATNAYSSAALTVTGSHPTAGAVAATLEGAFFGPGSPPENTGGQAKIQGVNYLAAGAYAAAKTP
jgi:hypothetical protein